MDAIDLKDVTLNKRTLSFPPPVEQAFLMERLPSKVSFCRTGIVVFCCLNLLLQYFSFRQFALIPSLLLIPLPIMMFFFKLKFQETKIDLFCCLSLFLTCSAVISMMIYLPNTLSNFPVLFFLMISGFVLFKIQYLFIGMTGFFLTITFGGCLAFFTEVKAAFIFHNTFFLLFATIIGMAAAYTIEYYSRMFFLKSSILEQTIEETQKNERLGNEELVRVNKSLKLEIRAHTEAEFQLKESEEKYRNLVISLPEGIFIVQNKKIVFLNPSMEKLTGYRAEELLGAEADLLFTKQVLIRDSGGGDPLDFFTRKNGQTIFVEKSFVEIRYNSQSALLFSVRDITEKINAMRDKKKLKNELEKAKKMEAFGILAGGVAHDLNNVLSGLVTTPGTLLMDLPENSDLAVHVEAIKDSGRRASAIAEELLTMVRGSAKTMGPVQLNHVIEDYFISPEFDILSRAHARVEIDRELDVHLPVMDASAIHISKIVMNLIANAVEAAGEGGGSVNVHTCTVEFSNQRIKGYEKIQNGRFIKFCVMNTGKGISQTDMEQIFEPFYSKKVLGRSGTGLGLSIVWNAVHDHNGYIHVNSKDGKTHFTLYFPISQSTGVSLEFPSQVYTLEDYSGNNEKILVVDDMENQQKIAMNMLRRLGYKVWAVSSGEEAIEHLRQNKIDLVVLDMVMEPGLGGLETYEHLLLIDPTIKAIITSGYEKMKEVESLQQLGAGQFVKKPYTLQSLGLAVKYEISDRKN